MSRGKQQLLIFAFGFILAAIIMAGGIFVYTRLTASGKIKSFQGADIKKQMVVVAVKKVEKGDELKPDSFKIVSRSASDVPANSLIDINYIQGKWAAAVMDPNTVITDSMVITQDQLYKPDERLKDYTLQGNLVAGTVKVGDLIDLEMVRTNGDTSIVLAKKQVKKLIDSKAIIQVTEAERYLINHALAEQTAGMGHIESLLYLDEKQPASKVKYVPAKIEGQQAAAAAPPPPPAQAPAPVQTPAQAPVASTPIPSNAPEGGKVR